MRRRWVAALAVSLTLALPARADDASDMHAATAGFYGVYATFHPSDGIPDAGDRAKYAPFISTQLDSLLDQAAQAEARFMTANKGSPPLVEGDLFSSLFEGATGVSVGACSGDAKAGRCSVSLRHTEPGKQPTEWSDTVLLVNTPAGWRVNDIAYGGTWAFGNKGTLSETLKQVLGFQ